MESLKGDRIGQHSIRINDQWRICFSWRNGDAYDVEIVEHDCEHMEMTGKYFEPIHPGEVLLEDFMKHFDITQYALAKAINVPARRINAIVHGKRAIAADTALRLGRYFGVDPQSWMNLHTHYALIAEQSLGDKLNKEVRCRIPGDGAKYSGSRRSFLDRRGFCGRE